MKFTLNKILKYITRDWSDHDYKPSRAKIIPPFYFELIAYLFAIALLFKFISYLIENFLIN